MKLKKRIGVIADRSEKITIPGEVVSLLEQYANYYFDTYQEKISTNELIIEMMKSFMHSDREFKKSVRYQSSAPDMAS